MIFGKDRAENDFSLYLTELHSAAGGREETVEHLLKAVKLALLDIPTGVKPISEDHRSRTLSRHLATCHQRGVRTDLPYPSFSVTRGLAWQKHLERHYACDIFYKEAAPGGNNESPCLHGTFGCILTHCFRIASISSSHVARDGSLQQTVG